MFHLTSTLPSGLFFSRRREVSPGGLLTPQQMRRTLERERARTDRSGDPFSFLVFTPADPETAPRTLARLAKILRCRLRITDEAGRLDRRRIGVMLPSTSTEGAWKVAKDVCMSFPPGCPPPLCRVYRYPGDWPGEKSATETSTERPRDREQPVGAMETFFVRPMPLWKRGMDILGASIGLMLCAPVFAAVAAAIKLTSPGPVFFTQTRSGLGGRRFTLYKFRSMHVGADALKATLREQNEHDGPAFKIRKDPRVTPVGRFLRKTSLDELPQLWNVLRGEMSLVGPRPLVCEEIAQCQVWQLRRLDVTPGLTCIWQIRGRSTVSFTDWIRMDLQYVQNQSPAGDLKLLVQTVPAVVFGRGAS